MTQFHLWKLMLLSLPNGVGNLELKFEGGREKNETSNTRRIRR